MFTPTRTAIIRTATLRMGTISTATLHTGTISTATLHTGTISTATIRTVIITGITGITNPSIESRISSIGYSKAGGAKLWMKQPRAGASELDASAQNTSVPPPRGYGVFPGKTP